MPVARKKLAEVQKIAESQMTFASAIAHIGAAHGGANSRTWGLR
jgi:hypothetical protein